jgi:hypothetical protein
MESNHLGFYTAGSDPTIVRLPSLHRGVSEIGEGHSYELFVWASFETPLYRWNDLHFTNNYFRRSQTPP